MSENRWLDLYIVYRVYSCIAVPAKQRALVVLELGGGRVHAADAVLRRGVQARVSRPRDLEALHEALRQDHREGAGGVRRDRQGGLPEPRAGRARRLHPHEQHPAAARAAGEDVRVDGRRQAGAGRRQHPQRPTEHAQHGARRPRHVVRRQPRAPHHQQRQGTRRPAAVRQGWRTGAAVAAQRGRR